MRRRGVRRGRWFAVAATGVAPVAAAVAAAVLTWGGSDDRSPHLAEPTVTAGRRPGPTYAPNDCQGTMRVEPSHMLFFCADAGASLTTIHWTTWSARRAFGTIGRLAYKNGCCGGNGILTGVRIELFRPRLLTDGRKAFVCARLTPGFDRAGKPCSVSLSGSWGDRRAVGLLPPCE